MLLTLPLSDDLAARLKLEAGAQDLSVEDFALRILDNAVANGADSQWRACNQRRLGLIRKQFTASLSPEEERELQQLQLLADQHLEALDNQRLDDLRRLREKVEQTVKKTSA